MSKRAVLRTTKARQKAVRIAARASIKANRKVLSKMNRVTKAPKAPKFKTYRGGRR